jgi:alanine racemase
MTGTSPTGAAPPAILDIDLTAVAGNYLFLKKKLKSGADCGAVVKADAYGLGVIPVSKALYDQNCRHFFVATFEEGDTLRHALPGEARIYALHGPNGASPEDFAAREIVPVLNSLPDVEHWAAFSARSGKKQPAVIHIDTGMNRLGLSTAEAGRLMPDLLKALDLRYVMSHLACPDEPVHPMNKTQLESFRMRTAALGVPCRLSLANSAGILLGEDWHFDLARPGCGLYGLNPRREGPNPVKGAVTLKAAVLQVRQIDSKCTVGYGATYTVTPPATLATLALGYADGYFRSLTGRGTVVIGGQECLVVGRVSMDSVVADVTALKIPPRPGDYAEIIGAHHTVEDAACEAGTIGYEVLTALGKRYRRTYTGA